MDGQSDISLLGVFPHEPSEETLARWREKGLLRTLPPGTKLRRVTPEDVIGMREDGTLARSDPAFHDAIVDAARSSLRRDQN